MGASILAARQHAHRALAHSATPTRSKTRTPRMKTGSARRALFFTVPLLPILLCFVLQASNLASHRVVLGRWCTDKCSDFNCGRRLISVSLRPRPIPASTRWLYFKEVWALTLIYFVLGGYTPNNDSTLPARQALWEGRRMEPRPGRRTLGKESPFAGFGDMGAFDAQRSLWYPRLECRSRQSTERLSLAGQPVIPASDPDETTGIRLAVVGLLSRISSLRPPRAKKAPQWSDVAQQRSHQPSVCCASGLVVYYPNTEGGRHGDEQIEWEPWDGPCPQLPSPLRPATQKK